ncbi:MAG: sugar transferase [Acidimicrobiia bacterium]|nr:sugar transferase [Acidimicrobiia bacterium]
MTQSAQTVSHPSQVASGAGDAGATRQRSTYERIGKGLIDRVFGLFLALITLPIVIPVAIVVFIDLGLPIFLRQERVGLDGKVFRVLKFRSMEPDRRASRVPSFVGTDRRLSHKSDNDPRLTPVGRFIRKWSLDELPQLWNVVFGQMSLVGPRPEMVQVVERYEPWQHARHQVKPGVTGLWQVSARGEVPMHEATHIDLEYVESISLATDIRILAKTVPAALGSRTGS